MKPKEEALLSARARLEQVKTMQEESVLFYQREAEEGRLIPNFVLRSPENVVPEEEDCH